MLKGFLIFLSILISLFFLAIYSYLYGGCVTDIQFARSQVTKHLGTKEISESLLRYDPQRSSDCKVSFIYEAPAAKIYYSVIDGGKVTWWDVNERGEL